MKLQFKNIEISIQNIPALDPGFIPIGTFMDAYLKLANKPLSLAVCRSGGEVSVHNTYIIGTTEYLDADRFYLERLVKILLWVKGGATVGVFGSDEMADFLASVYSESGSRCFDYEFMGRVYERQFEVKSLPISEIPAPCEQPYRVGGFLDGCRIGFDAGGSDRKVSAVINGEVVFSEEVVWHPKINPNPNYHFQGILDAFRSAAAHMPRVDAIGISSAGVYINNRAMIASLFNSIPRERFDKEVKDIYIRACKAIGDVPFMVANDGDVTALAGSMSLNAVNVLGIAMGTSQAVGYIDENGNITGWLNELAFMPVDCNPDAMVDEWSLDYGCGVKYFSQDAVAKLAASAGITLNGSLTPAEKLKAIQTLMEKNDDRATAVFADIGIYLGHSIPLYAKFYNIDHILLLGRVMSGSGGNEIIENARRVLKEEYPLLSAKISLNLPDERSRRVGQSVAAASLPALKL